MNEYMNTSISCCIQQIETKYTNIKLKEKMYIKLSKIIGWHDRSWTISISNTSLLLSTTTNNFTSLFRYIQWNSSYKISELWLLHSIYNTHLHNSTLK